MLDRDTACRRDLYKNRVERPILEWVMPGDRYQMSRRAGVSQTQMAAFLAYDFVPDPLKCPNQTVRWNSPGQLHAASTGMSSSLT